MKRISILLIMLTAMLAPLAMMGQEAKMAKNHSLGSRIDSSKGDRATMTVYKLATTLTSGKNYLIVNGQTVNPDGLALSHNSTTTTTVTSSFVEIMPGISSTGNVVYIPGADVDNTAIWTATSSNTNWRFSNYVSGTQYYVRNNNGTLAIATNSTNWTWNSNNHRLYNNNYYLTGSGSTFILSSSAASVYLYEETSVTAYTVSTSISPDGIGRVTGAGQYPSGATCTLTASTHNNEYAFSSWTVDGIVVSTTPTYSFTVSSDIDVVANFECIVSCPSPTNLTAGTALGHSVPLSWTSTAENFNIRYRTLGSETELFFDGFENGLDNWTTIRNGDGSSATDWQQGPTVSETAHTGSYTAQSRSWASAAYSVDNWLITPQVTLDGTLRFWVLDDGTYHEHFDVYVSTTGNNISDFSLLYEPGNASGSWTQVTVDLSSFDGVTGYIALRHTDRDKDYLEIDDFGIYGYTYGSWSASVPADENPFTLTGLASQTSYQAQVQANCGGGDLSGWSNRVTFTTTAPSTAAPTNLTVDENSITPNGATASWQGVAANDYHQYYELYYAESSVTSVPASPSAPNLISNITTTSCAISGLSPDTEYNVWVRDYCGTDGYSSWTPYQTFTTLEACPAPSNVTASPTNTTAAIRWTGFADSYIVQYAEIHTTTVLFEGFEGGSMPTGWDNSLCSSSSYPWKIGTGSGHTNYGTTSAANGSYNANYYCTTSSNYAYLITPAMDLASATEATLTFNYTNPAWSGGRYALTIYYRVNGGTWNQLDQYTDAQTDWTGKTVTLTGLANDYQIAFYVTGYNDDYGHGVGIDDVVVTAQSNSTWNTASSDATSPYTITGLEPETSYMVRVIGTCDGTPGRPSDAVTFTTLDNCAVPYELDATNVTAATATLNWTGAQNNYNVRYRTVTLGEATPTTEDFSGYTADNYNITSGGDRPSDWAYSTGNTSYVSPHVTSSSVLSSSWAISGMSDQGNYLYMVGPSNYAVMPRIENLTAFSFKYAFESANNGTFQVGYVTDASNISGSFTAFENISTPGSTSLATVTLTSTEINTLNSTNGARLAFYFNYSSNYGFGLDDITYTAQAITYGAWINKTNVASPLTITGLTPETTYEWQVQGINGICSGGTTDWSAPATFTTTDLETWVTTVQSKPSTYTAGATVDLHNANDLAWAISVVNGLNGQSAAPGTNFNVVADINMDASNWVPMGTSVNPYTGTFNGNGHIIDGIHSQLNTDNMGMFGYVGNNANIENMVLNVDFSGGNSVNMAAVAANMSGGTISNVEGAGTLTGGASTTSIGGLVGNKTGGTIHSSFAVNTITSGNATTHVGGLVGNNTGNLYNSYANTIISGTGQIGGLVGTNTGTVENCYAVVGSQTFPAFAYNNNGTIQFCYADNANGYVNTPGTGSTLQGHGTYGIVKDRKAIGYLYDDNAVTLVSGNNSYVASALAYNSAGTQIEKWPGLLSALNQWVNGHSGYTPWFRPTSSNINGDLPVLAFPKDNSMGTLDSDGKYLQYSAYDPANMATSNGLDRLLTDFANTTASIFLYNNATNVANVPTTNLKVFVNEDACLLQADGSGDFINTTVGITFDNSYKTSASDYFGIPLEYDWHLLSSPLQKAPMGMTYDPGTGFENPASINGMTGNYLPNGLVGQTTVKWDLYSFYEPLYHWINFKRATGDHWHYEWPHDNIPASDYTNETTFLQGKGYMAAISQDSYLNNTGTLNNCNNDIKVTLTHQSPEADELGCNLLGNPYQAYLDMSEFFTRNNTLGGSFWVYVAEGDNFMAGNSTASTNYATPSVTLHPHQAFFVKTPTDNLDVYFNYGMATAEPRGYSYYRGRIDYPLVNLFATSEKGGKDLTVIEVNRPILDGSPKLRALNNANFELYARMEGKDYSILFTEEGTERVAVCFKAKEDGNYTLSWDTQNGEFKYLRLIDNITGAECNMLTNDHYTFEAKATDLAMRFYVMFQGFEPQDSHEDFAYYNGNDWVVNGKGILLLIDVTGRVIYSEYLSGETNRVSLDRFAAGTYILNLNSRRQKILIK